MGFSQFVAGGNLSVNFDTDPRLDRIIGSAFSYGWYNSTDNLIHFRTPDMIFHVVGMEFTTVRSKIELSPITGSNIRILMGLVGSGYDFEYEYRVFSRAQSVDAVFIHQYGDLPSLWFTSDLGVGGTGMLFNSLLSSSPLSWLSAHELSIGGSVEDDVLHIATGQQGLLAGDVGSDSLRGAELADTIYGDWGDLQDPNSTYNDTIYGGAGGDFPYGAIGNDSIYGGPGNDKVSGGAGSDTLYGGNGNDIIEGESGVDKLLGGIGDDFIYVGREGIYDYSETQGGHRLYGGTGNDFLNAWSNDGSKRDILFGGGGNDLFYLQNGDLVADLSRGDEVWILNARPADWMVATALAPDAVKVSFHNGRLGAVSQLRIEGSVAPALFDVRYDIGGSIAVLSTGAAHAASRAQKVGFAQILSRTVDSLRDDVVPVGWEIVGGVGGSELISKLMFDKAEDVLPKLTRQLGEKAATGLINLAGGVAAAVAGSATKHLLGEYDELSDRNIALRYVEDVATAMLAVSLGIAFAGPAAATVSVWASLAGGTTVVVGVKVAEKFFENWFDAIEETLEAEADPQNIAESIYFRPIEPAPMDEGMFM